MCICIKIHIHVYIYMQQDLSARKPELGKLLLFRTEFRGLACKHICTYVCVYVYMYVYINITRPQCMKAGARQVVQGIQHLPNRYVACCSVL